MACNQAQKTAEYNFENVIRENNYTNIEISIICNINLPTDAFFTFCNELQMQTAFQDLLNAFGLRTLL
jgi:hypothetical protein